MAGELTAELLVHFMDQRDIEWACVWPLISSEAAPVAQPVKTGGALDRLLDAYPNLIGDLSEQYHDYPRART